MTLNEEEMKSIVKRVYYEQQIRQDLPKLEGKEIETKSVENVVEALGKVLDVGITLYGAYQFGEFLGRVAARVKQK